jgi:glycosyltransferase involved in cell wall biosynthesis
MPKIAVYTIALNEEKHVRQWFESAKDADLLLIADTGSTDKTTFIARALGIKVHQVEVKPWRFDIARNASLSLIPEDFDICIQLDMDETLSLGWREKVEKAWEEGNTWPIYKHVTSRFPDGSPHRYQHYFKIHPRKGFIWKYPIHEVIIARDGVQYRRELIDLEVDHIQDHTKSRGSYLDLLEMAVKEFPDDWRMAHYLNREYWYSGSWDKVLLTASPALKITGGWDVERGSTCMWASDSAQRLGHSEWALEWARRATEEAPSFYETWHWRAHISHLQGKWRECFDSAAKILTLDRQDHHLVKPEVWEWHGWDLLALSAHNLGDQKRAVQYGTRALIGSPKDERLKSNLGFYKTALDNLTKNNLGGSVANYDPSETFPIPNLPVGGTEILKDSLKKWCNFSESEINLIISRCDKSMIDDSKINILWQHLDSDQEAAQGFKDPEFVEKLDAIVFVSNWQYHSFRSRFSLPAEKCIVIKNALEPVRYRDRTPSDVIRLVYSSTPWRGLEVLLNAFELLERKDCELHVYSSTAIYGKSFYELNDKDWSHLYEKAKAMDNVFYRGYVPNDILKNELFDADILTYPSTWTETFCLSAVEAGVAGLRILTTNLGALPEVVGDRGTFVPYSDDRALLAKLFAQQLNDLIDEVKESNSNQFRLEQHLHFRENFSWDRRKNEWDSLFAKLKAKKFAK